jgi:putative endopeptidase
MLRSVAAGASSLILALLCNSATHAQSLAPGAAAGGAAPTAASAATPAPRPASGLDVAAMLPAVNPCEDFYRYACGGWMAAHPIPPDRPAWSRFSELSDRNRAILHTILEADAAPPPHQTEDQRKLGDFYSTCMDEAAANRQGIAPLQPQLDRIAALASAAQLPGLVAQLRAEGVGALFSLRSGQDFKDATSVIAGVDDGGFALPDRDLYLKNDAKTEEQRKQYREHVKRMFVLLGEPEARAEADTAAILEIETSLARASLDRVSRRDPDKTYHRVDRQQLAALTPSFSWDAFLTAIEAPPATAFNVSNPEFLRAVDAMLQPTPIDSWRAYLRWELVHSSAQWLSKPFVDEDFAFFGNKLGGARQLLPRWQRCVDATDRAMGEALGREFVAATFDPESKRRTLAMVGELESAMARDIAALPWMGAETKQRAADKLRAIANKIGYPEVWRDYSRLRVVRGDLTGNVERANAFELMRRLNKIGKPVDRLDWTMTPPTVNANYSPSMNDINFPAGILQPPFYDPKRDDAFNYGGIGAVIGHEMTHGFDDSGSKFDGHGNLANWWQPADLSEFQQRTTCIADEYSGFAAGGSHLNGRLTLGENTADNGGVRIAYLAYEASQEGKPHRTLDGLNPEQRFFLGYAQVWCSNVSPESERLQVLTNSHSPGRYRTDGVVVNMPEFQQAYHCPAGSPMAPANRCTVW